jgi:hypothetical protein
MRNWLERYIRASPPEAVPAVVRSPVSGDVCGGEDIARYGVATCYGPRMATKCQTCLHTLALERPTVDDDWPPFRAVTYDWDASLSERASREILGTTWRGGDTSNRPKRGQQDHDA